MTTVAVSYIFCHDQYQQASSLFAERGKAAPGAAFSGPAMRRFQWVVCDYGWRRAITIEGGACVR